MRLSTKVPSWIVRAVASYLNRRDVQEDTTTDRMLLCIVGQLRVYTNGRDAAQDRLDSRERDTT